MYLNAQCCTCEMWIVPIGVNFGCTACEQVFKEEEEAAKVDLCEDGRVLESQGRQSLLICYGCK